MLSNSIFKVQEQAKLINVRESLPPWKGLTKYRKTSWGDEDIQYFV